MTPEEEQDIIFEEEMAQWLKTRPECVRELAKEFPAGMSIKDEGKVLHLMGWTEDDTLIFTDLNPYDDYDKATENPIYICASHLRKK